MNPQHVWALMPPIISVRSAQMFVPVCASEIVAMSRTKLAHPEQDKRLQRVTGRLCDHKDRSSSRRLPTTTGTDRATLRDRFAHRRCAELDVTDERAVLVSNEGDAKTSGTARCGSDVKPNGLQS